jgi:hypothetical protein
MSHPSLDDLLQELAATRDLKRGSVEQIDRLRSLRQVCPAFAPALLALARNILLSNDESALSKGDPFSEVQAAISAAVRASPKADADALVEKAHFEWVLRDSAGRALEALEEAERRLRELLEDVLATKVRVLLELEDHSRAKEVARTALAWFPNSGLVQDAHAEAEREQP